MKMKWYFFFVTILAVSVLLYGLFEFSDEKTPEIGVLMVGENRYQKFTGLKKGLEDLGFEDKKIHFTVKNAKDDQGRLKRQIKSLLKSEPDIIVTLGGIETIELKKEIDKTNKSIPVVFAGLAAPKELGLIEDYRNPGSLFTGINNYHTSISGKRLEMLKNLVPSIERVFVIYDSTIDTSRLSLEEIQDASGKLKVPVVPSDVSSKDFHSSLETKITKEDAILVMPGFRLESMTDEIAELAKRKRVPAMGIYEYEAEKGLLASYGASFYSQGYQASRFVSLILQGNEPATLPVELPDEMKFVINQETKETLKLTYNEDLLSIADVIHQEEADE
ncbi:ABC transporter substrate-binding protein [Mesobacillus zeae]|uniref:ABC transporter substrate-binding protein n=1 Tax=Mesobacillus zeae TaxID=1917180 RepID=A0A398AZ47_9BACI|nr:ABC transporter substrate-binding protein [Mesobacillus zeae]RID82324.1 hypothetical protein D1970_19330 [Mesobacillus zeae]